MNKLDIKDARYASSAQEVAQEVIDELDDPNLNKLIVTNINVSRGKSDATVFIDAQDLSESEQKDILTKLKKARGFLESMMTLKLAKFRSPKLHFVFDDSISQAKKLDDIFKKISDERKKNSNDSI